MLYIDFDGVILDTEKLLFLPERQFVSEKEKIKHLQEIDWNFVLNNSEVINEAIYYLKEMNPNNSAILTKIHSLTNEGKAKVDWLRQNKVKQSVILVPYPLKKTAMVDAFGNILIDDCLRNLDDWVENGGGSFLFDIDDDGYDSWNQPNTKGYQKVLSLESFVSKK